MDAAAPVRAPKKPVAVQVFAAAPTLALLQIRCFLSFQGQLLAWRGFVVQSVNQGPQSVDEWENWMHVVRGWWVD